MISQLFRRSSKGVFRARSSERDATTDMEAVKSVALAIDLVLDQAKREQTGLKARMDNVIARAAIVGGNDLEDFASRAEDRTKMLRDSDADIQRGQQRLKVIDQNISNFEAVLAELQALFPNVKV